MRIQKTYVRAPLHERDRLMELIVRVFFFDRRNRLPQDTRPAAANSEANCHDFLGLTDLP